MEDKDILAQLPSPPEGSPFTLQKVETVSIPHPYMIGTGHVTIAAERFSGMLGVEAIEAAERSGYGCQYHGRKGCRLSYKEHETQKTLFVLLDKAPPRNLWEVQGLQAYLLSIEKQATSLGIQGFAFPHKK